RNCWPRWWTVLVSHPVIAKDVAFGDRIERPRSEAVDFYSERIVDSICPTCGRSFKYRPHQLVWDEAAKKSNVQHDHNRTTRRRATRAETPPTDSPDAHLTSLCVQGVTEIDS